MSAKKAIDSVEFFSQLDTARSDNKKVVDFYDNVAENYNETLKEIGYTNTTDYLASLVKKQLGELEKDFLATGAGPRNTAQL